METYCDRCNDAADQRIDVRRGEVAELARDLGYRSVCPGCYDDLVAEAREASEQQSDDRRAERRVAAHVPVRVEPADGGAAEETVAEDISEHGAQIRAYAHLEPGSVVRVTTADGSAEAVALVEIVWRDGDALRAGLKLVEPSDSWLLLVRQLEQ